MYHHHHDLARYDEEGYPRRTPGEIRDELTLVRELLRNTEETMQRSEAERERLLLSLSDEGYEDREEIRKLELLCDECLTIKATLEELWDRTDALAEELEDALFWLRGGAA